MKLITTIFVILAAFLGGTVYGYKQAADDSAALAHYIEMANGYTHLKIVEEKGLHSLRDFLVTDIRTTTSTHAYGMRSQSLLSNLYGPNNESYSGTNRAEYYAAIVKYFQSLSSTEENKNTLQELEWLLESTN